MCIWILRLNLPSFQRAWRSDDKQMRSSSRFDKKPAVRVANYARIFDMHSSPTNIARNFVGVGHFLANRIRNYVTCLKVVCSLREHTSRNLASSDKRALRGVATETLAYSGIIRAIRLSLGLAIETHSL